MKGLYYILFPNGKWYIGQSCRCIYERVRAHFKPSTKSYPIDRACNKYKQSDCVIKYIECPDLSDKQIKDREVKIIASFREKGEVLYNITDGGEGVKAYKVDLPVENIVSLYDQGKSLNYISDKYNVSIDTIITRLKNKNVRIRSKGEQNKKYLDFHKVKTMYDNGIGVGKIAKKLQTSTKLVTRTLKENGVIPKRDQTGESNPFYVDLEPYRDLITTSYQCGISQRQISKGIGVSYPTVVRRLKQWGVK